MSKLYSYSSKFGLKSDKFYSSMESLMQKLQEDWDKSGAGMLLEHAIEDGYIKISAFETE